MTERQEGAARKALRDASDRLSEKLALFYEEALDATKEIRAECEKCKRYTRVIVPDWMQRRAALNDMLEQGYGKPKSESEGGGNIELIVQGWMPRDPEQYAALSDEDKAVIDRADEIMAEWSK